MDGVTTEGCAKEQSVWAHGEGHRHTYKPSMYNFWKMTFFSFLTCTPTKEMYFYMKNSMTFQPNDKA